MISICFYFQVHQPFRLRKDYTFFNIGEDHLYEDDKANREICNKVSEKCYIPANRLMLELIQKHGPRFKISYAITGTAIEQFERYNPEVLDLFRELNDTGCVEFINETYYHSLSFLFSRKEFRKQVVKHRRAMEERFGTTPKTFRNTELIYNNELARVIEDMGFTTILAEGADRIIGWRTPNFVYQPASCYRLCLLLKNYRLSDDIAFRFSNRAWNEWPLSVEKYRNWLKAVEGNGEVVNLFMDYETLGEHQWADTGIFNFIRSMPDQLLGTGDFCFQTPSEVAATHSPMAKIDAPHYVSWADVERDTTAWIGNDLQDSAISYIYDMEKDIYKTKDTNLIEIWRRLQTSDHFYYMCTKWFSDGDVHKYFNPYDSPHNAFITYMNALNDLNEQLRQHPALS